MHYFQLYILIALTRFHLSKVRSFHVNCKSPLCPPKITTNTNGEPQRPEWSVPKAATTRDSINGLSQSTVHPIHQKVSCRPTCKSNGLRSLVLVDCAASLAEINNR